MIPTSNDELGELMRSFQLMTNNLRQARNDLEEWGRTLEEKVKERSEQLQRMQMQLVHTEKLASLGELVAGIAHEINNPLSGILIFSSLAAKDKRLDPALKGDLETISSEAQRCAGIVKGLLEFARDYQPKMTPCNINQVLLDSLRLVECQSVFQNVAIMRQLGSDLPEIMADQNQLKQVFINIFINAGQAMQDQKRGELQIITRADREPDDGVVVTISDSGCGVPEEQLGKLFDPFFTTKGTGGTGLGLSVSYGIIQAHGGTIKAESDLGMGMTFSIWLPRCAEGVQPVTNGQNLLA
jgi:two-component system NtrC family sensor kinase